MLKRISYLILSLLLVACTQYQAEMQHAEQQMENAPDSALHILQRIPADKIFGSGNRALYALLMSQAMDKNNIKSESDSLTSIATDYFDADEPERAGYAWFYHARTANNRGDAQEQADNLLKAQEYAEQTDNYKLRGLVYGDKGVMYQSQREFVRSIYFFDKAYKCALRINNYRSCIVNLVNIGFAALYIDSRIQLTNATLWLNI